jgi:hypothetical protein
LDFSESSPNDSVASAGWHKTAVSTVDLADLVRKHKVTKIDILKIDCEGCEFAALPHLDRAGVLDMVKVGPGEIHPRCALSQQCRTPLTELDRVTSIACSRFNWPVPWGKCCPGMVNKATAGDGDLCSDLQCIQTQCPSLIHPGHLVS